MELQQRLNQIVMVYLRGEIDVAAFERAFWPMLPAAVSPPSEAGLQQFAMAIDRLLVDMDHGEAAEADLRAYLAGAARTRHGAQPAVHQ